ncbi:MAG TPA: phosphate acyltransferase PlsX [Peptococcaceae bacterium]|jgi:glycerol-3-phosphate acyltransferase PlsX|nr:phosphate acyltransferase PlsX [Clostridia bacterium]HOB81219.1 phosphate acyltransferase PlsX [Peptococcaceae bacterium]HPZ70714.1 phosphate acyltransferase PlsX [Peptococcaceae bacterium]HQD53305.1 phosphate acyltransferase PlsX [Peptococcaceae bacterium]
MRIVVDAMGGDYAPREIVQGALQALTVNPDLHIILVGREDAIKECLPEGYDQKRVTIHHCTEVIGMDEHPAQAYRRKKDASITVATRLVKEKQGDALVSAGSTGAQLAAALFGLGRLEGIERPAILTVIPGAHKPKLLLDAGANSDCKPEHLVQFALMGSIYAEELLGMVNPAVGLISNGTEETKGSELVVKVHQLLKNNPAINFYGNVEGREVLQGPADVLVCDGFVGNVILKVLEGMAVTLFGLLKEELQKNFRAKAGALLLKPVLKALKARLDYAEYGGAPLLGVDGISIICHGSSKAYAIQNAVCVAASCVEKEVVRKLSERIKTMNEAKKADAN